MGETRRSRGRLWAVVLLAGLAAAAIYFALPSTRDRIVVRTATAQTADLLSTVSTNGRVEPVVDFQAHAPIPSTIEDLPIKLGEHVSQGQELVALNASDARSRIASAQASVTGAEMTLQNMQRGGTQDELLSERADLNAARMQQRDAERTVASLQALEAKGAASPNEVANAQGKVADAQARIAQIQSRLGGRYGAGEIAAQRAQVSQARAGLGSAQSSLGGLVVRSPISGTVYALPYARFDFVPAGDTLVNVADLSRLQVRAYFDEPVIGKLAVGQTVRIVWDAKPNQAWHGRVTQAPTTVITYNGTRNVGVCLVSVDDASADLIPNTNVTVTVTTLSRLGVLSLPREALHSSGSSHFVLKVVDGRLVKAPVTIGISNLTRFEITGGLKSGDTVALGALTDTELTDGMRVRAQS